MKKLFAWSLASAVFLLASLSSVYAQDEFYRGKTVRVIVGASAGGGYDTYSRTLARHMGKHIPGNPAIVVDNMPGAGFLISANYMYKIAKPDGLTIGHFIGGLSVRGSSRAVVFRDLLRPSPAPPVKFTAPEYRRNAAALIAEAAHIPIARQQG